MEKPLIYQYHTSSGEPIALYHKQVGLAIGINANQQVYSFDLEGRLTSFFDRGVFYQRGLDHRLLKKFRDEQGLQRHLVSEIEKNQLLHKLYQRLGTIYQDLAENPDPQVQSFLQTLKQWSPERLENHGQRFGQIYQPISILPPDQYLSIVLQLTEGCSYNRCSFCNFYKDRPFRIKDQTAFSSHIQDVIEILGASSKYRQGIFLADGDALMTPQKRLVESIGLLRQSFPDLPLYSFMDAFRPQAKSQVDFEQLAHMGLIRVYLGIETGHPALLAFLEKPGTPELMQQEALKIKQAGVALGLIFMVGVGGENFRETHFKDSLQWLKTLPLDLRDRIFLSQFIAHPEQKYQAKAQDTGIQPLAPSALGDEISRWRQALADLPAKIVPYHLQEFIY